jgi:phosphohistidine swiveling domain-containing protein
LEHQIADKRVMTTRVATANGANAGTEEQPVPADLRRAPVLDDEAAAELNRLGVEIEGLYGMPMDIEWAVAGGKPAIVQARPITALPEPEVEPPTEWPLPDPRGKYVRASIIDLMPDPISPLFATMGFRDYDAGLSRAMSDVTRSRAVLPSHFVTINDYAYSDTRFSVRELWWVLTRMVPAFPRMLRIGLSYWRAHGRAPYVETVCRWEGQPLAELSAADLLEGACEIAKAAMYNLTAQMVWMGACAGSEMLFTRVYDRLVKRSGEPDAVAFLMGYDSTPIRSEKSLYDMAMWCRGHDALAAHVLNAPSGQLVAQLESVQVPTDVAADDWQTFRERFRAHVQQFGHIIYDLDFAKPLPLDNSAPMLETVKLYLRGDGANPHERQGALEARRVQAVDAVLSRVKGLKRWAFRKTLSWAQSLAKAREDALADIGLGYPVLRRMLRELGGRLVGVRTLQHPDDVFWLRQGELEQAVAALERDEPLPALGERVRERRAFARAAKRVTPPPVLPASVKKVMGVSLEGMVAAGESSHTDNMIVGAGTSAGQVTAPACVLHGPEDFGQMQSGRVLVAAITTPAWTPLFAMAAAVVTDVGGPLSHGSIVAREYGIPAVMGTGVATRRIRSGQTITVDGSTGQVLLVQESDL